jgi:hypothetical protein
MIRTVRGALLEAVRETDRIAHIVAERSGEEMDLEILDRQEPLGAGTDVLAVEARIAAGVRDRRFRVLLGSAGSTDPAPVEAGALRMTPVILAGEAERLLVATGAIRAGKGAQIETLSSGRPALGARLLQSAASGSEILLVTGGDRRTLELARVLHGRPVPVVPLADEEALRGLLGRCRVEVDVPIPALDAEERSSIWALLRSLGIDVAHHLVEVDPRPALDELGLDRASASLGDRAAAVAGVLAGRLAAANRGWRSAFD